MYHNTIVNMRKTIGYMITFTTYGTWLQGDNRGYVKNGQILKKNYKLKESNKQNLKTNPVRLTVEQKKIVYQAILEKAKQIGQKIPALYVATNHVHIVAEYIPKPIYIIARHYKICGEQALKTRGFADKVWTKGFDRRFCYSQEELDGRVKYVNSHFKNT